MPGKKGRGKRLPPCPNDEMQPEITHLEQLTAVPDVKYDCQGTDIANTRNGLQCSGNSTSVPETLPSGHDNTARTSHQKHQKNSEKTRKDFTSDNTLEPDCLNTQQGTNGQQQSGVNGNLFSNGFSRKKSSKEKKSSTDGRVEQRHAHNSKDVRQNSACPPVLQKHFGNKNCFSDYSEKIKEGKTTSMGNQQISFIPDSKKDSKHNLLPKLDSNDQLSKMSQKTKNEVLRQAKSATLQNAVCCNGYSATLSSNLSDQSNLTGDAHPSNLSDQSNLIGDAHPSNLSDQSNLTGDAYSSSVGLKKRPGFGTKGRSIKLISNYLVLSRNKKKKIYHYNVKIIPLGKHRRFEERKTKTESKLEGQSKIDFQQEMRVGKIRRQQVFFHWVESNKLEEYHPLYDNEENAYSSFPLPLAGLRSFPVTLKGFGERKFELEIIPVVKDDGSNELEISYSLKTNEVLTALNTIMSYRSYKSSHIRIGRAFFNLNHHNRFQLGEGLEIWKGYNQSVNAIQQGVALVVNLSSKAFHKSIPVIKYIEEYFRRDIDKLNWQQWDHISEVLKGLKVTVTHLQYSSKKYTIERITDKPANKLHLDNDPRQKTVSKYFEEKYGKLKYSHLPCLQEKLTKPRNDMKNYRYLPIEHCVVAEHQPKQGFLSGKCNAVMIKETAVAPVDRFRQIEQIAQGIKRETSEMANSFGLFMELEFINVEGRVLQPPGIEYANKCQAEPDLRGVWRINGKFHHKARVGDWGIIDFVGCGEGNLQKFADLLKDAGRKTGLEFKQLVGPINPGRESIEKVLKDMKKINVSIVVIVLDKRSAYRHAYDEIKFLADYRLGMVTQCVDQGVVCRMNNQIATNLCLKMNVKLGGINHVLSPKVFAKPTIVFGADVVHSGRDSDCPSIAAVVGSLDSLPSRYQLVCKTMSRHDEKCSQEVILVLQEMVEKILVAYKEATEGKIPERAIFFRDGVSEGQFEEVYRTEMRQLQAAYQVVFGRIVPTTFIIVQKRIHTRFRPENPKDSVGPEGNVPPGTVVDTVVTHPHRFDFYLHSHEGLKGTSKPVRYTVLHDDNSFSADGIQQVAHHLCHTYFRCNRSISIPAPVKYADLACYRAKLYADFLIHQHKEDLQRRSGPYSRPIKVGLPDEAREAIHDMNAYPHKMFYL